MEKMRNYFRQSLARRFVGLMSIFIALFFVGAFILFFYQSSLTHSFEKKQLQLEKKEKYAQEIERAFYQAFFDVRGYLAFGRKEFKLSVFRERENVHSALQKLEAVADEQEDREFLLTAREFNNYYFNTLVTKAIEDFENGDIQAVLRMSENGGTAAIEQFQLQMSNYRKYLNQKLKQQFFELKERQYESQIAFVIFIFVMLFLLMMIIRMMLRQIGKPLTQLAHAAEKIANDEANVQLSVSTERSDEIGKLSRAFMKMLQSIQEKEESLMAQNEELLAQQDELETQQAELEQALEAMHMREQELERRNELINGLANSLDKQEVLDSIVRNMCNIMNADRGMIVLLNEEKTYAACGLSSYGVDQFLTYIHNGLHQRLFETKTAFSLKREVLPAEKGYHEETLYVYDLFLPVLSPTNDVEAIMVFSRFSGSFSDEEIDEYEGLAKQISISLQKINLYEESEKDRRMVQDILNTIQEGIQLVDRMGTNIIVNAQMAQWLGKSDVDELRDIPYDDWKKALVANVADGEKLCTYFENVIFATAGESEPFIYHLQSEKREVIQVYAKELYRGGEKIGTVFVHRDITKEFEVDQMKSELVSTVSHELRTPLSSVLGFTELMLNKELKPERQRKYLMTIYQEAKRLTALINNFLDVQRMESGKQTYDKKYEDLVPIIENVVETQKVNTTIHHIHIQKETTNTVVLGDRDKLAQVFTNLLSNAIKYSPNGGNITIRLYEQNHRLHVDVQDEGLGIPEEAIPHLFTKFYRVDNSDRRRIGGTGLGLAIVKEIVKAHGGEVSVVSEVKKGSTFTVSFPLVIKMKKEETDESLSLQEKTNGNHAHVLIIEDDENLAVLLETELKDSGFHVKHLKEGKKALEVIQKEKPDAIVLDIMLEENDLSGWDILQKIKQSPELASIPIVISSALEEKEKGLSLGASSYLVKPYQPSQLSKIILQLLLKRERQGEIFVPMESE
jgi:signal transduction histidine kinase/CHASE3 domain sensor protein/ActR/RegA family two-component response regulator